MRRLTALVDATPSRSSTDSIKGQPSQAGPWHHWNPRLIAGLEVHRYAPERNKLHLLE